MNQILSNQSKQSNPNYSFDTAKNSWYQGKKPIEEENVLIELIQYAKSQHIRNAGEWAESELNRMKQSPEVTARAWTKRRIIRNRNNRIAGKYLFASWCHAVGIEIVGDLVDFMVRNSLLVFRFYNELSAVFGCYRKEARVFGKVCHSVFFGIDIRIHEFEPDNHPKPITSSERHKFETLRRHMEFMSKVFSADP